METPDNIVFSQALQSDGLSDASPFVKRELLYIQDNNGSGNYASNQVIFDASVFSNNGKLNNWQEAKILIPCVIPVTCRTGDVSWDNSAITNTDFMVALKNCNTSLLHSYSIDFGNSNVINQTQHINMYHAFKFNTELDGDEEELLGAEIGYAKDTADSWQYRSAHSALGTGLLNNANAYLGSVKNSATSADSSVANTGMLKRQENAWRRCGVNTLVDDGKSLVLGGNETTHFRNQAINYVTNNNSGTTKYKCYYYTAVIRLKDLQFFSSPDFPKLMRNAYFKLTLNINQVFFEFTKPADGTIRFQSSSLQLTTGGTNPLMVAASYVTAAAGSGTLITQATAAARLTPCGSACVPASDANGTYQMSLSVCRPIFTHIANNVNITSAIQPHVLSSCRLYVPAYTLQPQKEAQLLAVRQRQIKFTDIVPYTIYNAIGSFSSIITSGVARAKRLIIVPVMSEASNAQETGAFSDIQSPFSTSPSTTCPTLINNFQVMVGGVPLYPQPINYSFENFFTEMTNTSAGGMIVDHLVAGRISMRDYISGMYSYYVVDLKRRAVEDENTLVSVQVQGTLVSAKAVHLFCFIEYEKALVCDIATGQRLT
jgi:hypothetical protein